MVPVIRRHGIGVNSTVLSNAYRPSPQERMIELNESGGPATAKDLNDRVMVVVVAAVAMATMRPLVGSLFLGFYKQWSNNQYFLMLEDMSNT